MPFKRRYKSKYFSIETPEGPLHVHIDYDKSGIKKVFTGELSRKPMTLVTGSVKYFKLYNCETKMFDLARITNDGNVEIFARSVDKIYYGKYY